jgi:alpha-tubulin suppressor-like RCC1 family protein
MLFSPRLPAVALSLLALFIPRRALACEEITPTRQISVGSAQICGVGTDGGLYCWRMLSSAAPVRLPAEHVVQVAVGYTHTCALDAEGVVWCWGDGRDGEIGDGDRRDRRAPTPVRGLSDVVSIASGTWRSCAVRVDGRLFCWGNGILGALGDGLSHTSDLPVQVDGIADAISVAVGEDHACAVHASGRLSCWGRNTWGQLGNDSKEDAFLPRTVVLREPGEHGWRTKDLDGIVSVSAGYAHTCALRFDGHVCCWGANWYGQLGNTSKALATTPRLVGLSRVRAISVGNLNSFALLSDGTIRGWGSNAQGQLGDAAPRFAFEPVEPRFGDGDAAAPLADIVAIAGGDHACALDASGVLRCWGSGHVGQLGDGRSVQRSGPVRVLPFVRE